jgi:phosphatidylserine decarboxylase
MEMLKIVMVPIHPAGWIFIAIAAFTSLVLGLFYPPLGWLGLVITLWMVYFFRDPERVTPQDDSLIISPADGVVQLITKVPPPAELDMGSEPVTRVSVFLNVFNVHVNRVPAGGTITKLHYYPGLFLNASLDKASTDNERQLVKVTTAKGQNIGFVQIAGLVARRIICDLKEGQQVQAGERFGLIRFGSRMDIYLPAGVEPSVLIGQTAIGGETVIARMP